MFRDLIDFVLGSNVPGHETSRSHSWPFPPSVTVLLLITAAAFVFFVYSRERGTATRAMKLALATIRIALVALVVFMLYGWMLHRHRTDLPDLVLMLDDSQSMSLADRYDDKSLEGRLANRLRAIGFEELSRLNLAKLLLLEDDGELLAELSKQYNLKFYRVGASIRAQPVAGGSPQANSAAADEDLPLDAIESIEATQTASRLGKGVRNVLQTQRGRPTAAIVIMTDGVTTDGPSLSEVADYARRKAVPLYIVGVGNDKPPSDLRVSDLLADEVAFVGDLVKFDFKVTGSGYTGQRVDVRLKRKNADSQAAGEVVSQQPITIGADGQPQSVQLGYRATEQGDFEFVVEIEPREEESNIENNVQTHLLRVRDETLRVLYVQETPSFEFRYLKTMLSRELKQGGTEKSIELTTVLQEADLEYTELDETAARVFPVSRDELFRYDVVIFGDVNPSFLSRSVMENISAFVEERGGGLIFLSGPRHTPLAYRDTPLEHLFPVDLATVSLPPRGVELSEPNTIMPSRLGMAAPPMQLSDELAGSLQVWRQFPPVYWMLQSPDLRPGARVLAEEPSRTGVTGQNVPAICLQFIGAGKVIFHTFDESYRWARHPDGDLYYSRYWIQTLRYLSRSKLLGESRVAELKSDRQQYRRGDPVRLRVRFFDDRLAPPQDDGVTVIVEMDGGKRRQIQLQRDAANRGIFEGTISNLPEGRFRAWIATPTFEGQPPSQPFDVVAPPGELARMEMDIADLQAAAKTSEGEFFTIANADGLLDALPQGRQVRIETLPPSPVWNSSLLAMLFVALILTEWLLRKRVGLL